MKKFGLLILSIISLFGATQLKASHLWGGEITWECLSNGKFIFRMNIYRDCSGAPFQYVNQTLNILGANLPNGGTMSSIIVKPDTNKWTTLNSGAINVSCHSVSPLYSCQNGDVGALQVFYFASDPIHLYGTPPATGWTFFWSGNSRPYVLNGVSGPLGLRTTMYPILNPSGSPQYLSTDICSDNSPQFSENPEPVFCRGLTIDYNNRVEDKEFDSLSYSLDQPLGGSLNTVLNYGTGYSNVQPLPSTTADPNNIPLSLDVNSGHMNFAVHNGSGRASYLTVIRVDAYRNGQRIASVYRDIPLQFIDCNPLSHGSINNNPTIMFSGSASNMYQVTVNAGSLLQLPIQVADSDIDTSRTLSPFQQVTASFSSNIFSKNFVNPIFCSTSSFFPCVTLSPAPTLNSNTNKYEYSNVSGFSTVLSWQTDSSHLGVNYSPKKYYITVRAVDDHCVAPAVTYATVEIIVLPNTTTIEEVDKKQNLVQISPNPSNGKIVIQSKSEKIRRLRLFNLNGQLVSESEVLLNYQVGFDIQEPSGVYLLEVENEVGEKVRKKIIRY